VGKVEERIGDGLERPLPGQDAGEQRTGAQGQKGRLARGSQGECDKKTKQNENRAINPLPTFAINLHDQEGESKREKKFVAKIGRRIGPPRCERHRSPFLKLVPRDHEGAPSRDPKIPAKRINQRNQGAGTEADKPLAPRPLKTGLNQRDHEQPPQADDKATVKIRPDDHGEDVKKSRNRAAMAFDLKPVKPERKEDVGEGHAPDGGLEGRQEREKHERVKGGDEGRRSAPP